MSADHGHVDTTGRLEDLLQLSDERFLMLSRFTPCGVFTCQIGTRFTTVNTSLCELLAAGTEQLLGTGWREFIHEQSRDVVVDGMQAALDGEPLDLEARVITGTGDDRWVRFRVSAVAPQGFSTGLIGTVEDLTSQRTASSAARWQATHDPVTGLGNRDQLVRGLLAGRTAGVTHITLVNIRLKSAAALRSALGEDGLDDVRRQVGEVLRRTIRDSDIALRLGADDFGVAAFDIEATHAGALARRLKESLQRPVSVHGSEIELDHVVGVLRAPIATNPDDLLADVNDLLNQALASPRSAATALESTIKAERSRRDQVVDALHDAVDAERIPIRYSPVLFSGTGTVALVEGRCGWKHETAQPEDLGQIEEWAHAAGFGSDLADAVLTKACADYGGWKRMGKAPVQLLVPVTALQLLSPAFADRMARIALVNGLTAGELVLDIAETTWVNEDVLLAKVVGELRELGFHLSIGDVGAGSSSLSMLAHLPIELMRIDPSVIGKPNEVSDAVLSGLVGIARSRSVQTMAVDLRSRGQLDRARALGFDLVAGPSVEHLIELRRTHALCAGTPSRARSPEHDLGVS
jgi:PAS domain S-box-containing protein/diguanylate cyclase (GGDEF)-like protein